MNLEDQIISYEPWDQELPEETRQWFDSILNDEFSGPIMKDLILERLRALPLDDDRLRYILKEAIDKLFRI